MKKPSSRNQRGNKGIKVKHILQICVLLGVCIWLIYQVKYSHDKKKKFYENDDKKSADSLSESEDGLVKLGRKDLLPVYLSNQKEKNIEEDEDEEEVTHGEEEKDVKSKVDNGNHEEEEEEDDDENKHEEDDIDEQDQSKFSEDTDKDDEFLEEEKESGSNERDEKENETDMTVDEAREEHYKADDASSAVSHESRILNAEKSKESSGNSTETSHENNVNATISEVKIQVKLGESESSGFVNETATKVKDGESESSSSETKSWVIETKGGTFNNNSTEAVLEASSVVQNETEIKQNRSQEHGAPPAVFSDLKTGFKLEQTHIESDPNITVSANITNKDSTQVESKNSTSESSPIENISGSNTTVVKEKTGSEGDDKSGEKESSNLPNTEQTKEADDASETSISQEERETLTDPQTLPDIRLEANEDEEEAIGEE